jgi:hypothetical protein
MNYQMRISYSQSLNSNERETVDHTLQYLGRKFGSWSVFAPPVTYPRIPPLNMELFDMIPNLLSLEEMRNCKSSLYPSKLLALRF